MNFIVRQFKGIITYVFAYYTQWDYPFLLYLKCQHLVLSIFSINQSSIKSESQKLIFFTFLNL